MSGAQLSLILLHFQHLPSPLLEPRSSSCAFLFLGFLGASLHVCVISLSSVSSTQSITACG